MGNVVLCASNIRTDVVTGFHCTVTMDVSSPIIYLFFLRLTPSVVAAVYIRLVGSHVAASPLRAGGQSEVDGMGMVVIGT